MRTAQSPGDQDPAVAGEARMPVSESWLRDPESRAFRRKIPEHEGSRVLVIGGDRAAIARHGHAVHGRVLLGKPDKLPAREPAKVTPGELSGAAGFWTGRDDV